MRFALRQHSVPILSSSFSSGKVPSRATCRLLKSANGEMRDSHINSSLFLQLFIFTLHSSLQHQSSSRECLFVRIVFSPQSGKKYRMIPLDFGRLLLHCYRRNCGHLARGLLLSNLLPSRTTLRPPRSKEKNRASGFRHHFFRFAFTFAHLARCAAAILFRPAADMVCRSPRTFLGLAPSR